MRIFAAIAAFLILGAFAAGSEPGAALRFDHMPLGNVARILSARFHAPVTIGAGAQAPVSGDFSRMDLRHALAEAARQAGLTVVPLGADPAAGFALAPPSPKEAGLPAPAEAGRRRAELLRRRTELLKAAALLGPPDPAS